MGETTSGATTWNVICAFDVVMDDDTSTSTSHNFREPSKRTHTIREFNFNNGSVSVSENRKRRLIVELKIENHSKFYIRNIFYTLPTI